MSDKDVAENHSQWAGSFLNDLHSHWLNAIAGHDGLFLPEFARDWSPDPSDRPLTLVSQCRLVYTMATAFRITGNDRYKSVAFAGLDVLEVNFRVGSNAHYAWSVNRDGTHDITEINTYGTAFIILALATASSAFNQSDLSEKAFATWEYMHDALIDSHGGLAWHRPIQRRDIPFDAKSQNPVMHTFEALMAIAASSAASPEIANSSRDAAAKLLTFLRTLPGFSRGRLVEWYDPLWRPMPVENGGILDLGHAFEWAFLLSDWHALTDDKSALAESESFLNTAITWGLMDDGSTIASCTLDGTIVSPISGLWQQCEAVRALHRHGFHHGNELARLNFEKALNYYQANFVDIEYGGVYAGPIVDGELKFDDKGDGWKLDYHTTNMLLELNNKSYRTKLR